ncbi:MAG: hypothetical protein ABWY11_15085 [Umezawaea sp.]
MTFLTWVLFLLWRARVVPLVLVLRVFFAVLLAVFPKSWVFVPVRLFAGRDPPARR